MFQVSEAGELVAVFAMVLLGLALLYFAERWMDKDEDS